MKHTLLSLLTLLAFAGPMQAQNVGTDHYTGKNFDCVIFPGTYPTELGGKAFTPTHDDADKAEKALQDNLKTIKVSNKEDRNGIVKTLPKYKIQLFGFADKGGDKIVFMNCFRNDKDKDKELAKTWLTDMVQVQGGGTYFFTIKYDLTKGNLFDFQINGNVAQ